MAASNEEAKERCMKAYREEKRNVKRCIIQSKNKVNEQFGKKTNEDVNGNRKLFWKKVSNVKGGKVESCGRIKDGNGRLVQGRDDYGRSILKVFIIEIMRNRVHSTCLALIGFGEITTSEKS